MTTDWRALCVELTEVLRRQHDWYIEDNGATLPQLDELVVRAQAALAEPEPEGPTVMEIIELADEIEAAELGQVDLVRAALARWGNSAPQPANSEVAERLDRYDQALSAVMPPDFKDWWKNSKEEWPDIAAGVIENLRQREELAWEQVARLSPPQPIPVSERLPGPVPFCERNWDSIMSPSGGYEMDVDAVLRDGAQLVNGEWWAPVFGCDSLESALYLIRRRLEWLAPEPVLPEGTPVIEPTEHTLLVPVPQPIPVSERLPGPGDCDAEGRCWWWCSPAERWLRIGIPQPDQASQVHTHWLPAHALPVPEGR